MKLRTRILLPSFAFLVILLVLGATQFYQNRNMNARMEKLIAMENQFHSVFQVLSQKTNEHLRLSMQIWRLNAALSDEQLRTQHQQDYRKLKDDIPSYLVTAHNFLNEFPADTDVRVPRKYLDQLSKTLTRYFETIDLALSNQFEDRHTADLMLLQSTKLSAQMNEQIRQSLLSIEKLLHEFFIHDRETNYQILNLLWWACFIFALIFITAYSVISSNISDKIEGIVSRLTHLFPEAGLSPHDLETYEGVTQLEWLAQRLEDTKSELDASRDRFEKLISHSSTAIYVHRHMMPLYCNQALVDLFGFDNAEEVLNLTTTEDLLAPHERRRVIAFHEARMRGEKAPTIYELEIMTKDGTPKWVLNKSFAFEWEGETAVCTNLIDISDRKTAERELIDSEDRFRGLLELTPDPIFIYREDGSILDANMAASHALGYSAMELRDMNIHDFTAEKDCAPDGPPHTLQTYYRRKDASVFPVEISIRQGTLDQEPVFLAIIHDMSDTLAQIQEIETIRQKAEKISQAKSNFLSMMSHELRTPLNSILGYSDLYLQNAAKSQNANDEQAAWVEQIRLSGQNLLEIVDKVLEFISIDMPGPLDAESGSDLVHTLENALENYAQQAQDRGVNLHCDLSAYDDLPVKVPPKHLQIIVDNVLSNAIKYNIKEGHVHIEVQENSPNTIDLVFSDTGPGIDPENVEKAFQPFERLGQEHGTISGSGIGLTLVERACTQIEGKITIQRAPNGGCRVTVSLPKAYLT